MVLNQMKQNYIWFYMIPNERVLIKPKSSGLNQEPTRNKASCFGSYVMFLEALASLDLALSLTHTLTQSLTHSQTLLRIHAPVQAFGSPARSYKTLQDSTRS